MILAASSWSHYPPLAAPGAWPLYSLPVGSQYVRLESPRLREFPRSLNARVDLELTVDSLAFLVSLSRSCLHSIHPPTWRLGGDAPGSRFTPKLHRLAVEISPNKPHRYPPLDHTTNRATRAALKCKSLTWTV